MVKEKKEINFSDWLRTKKVSGFFAVVSLVSGLFFMGQKLTGNVILNKGYTLSLLPIIGMLLIFCSIILGLYSLKKK